MRSPATVRCVSTASRAMNRRMISDGALEDPVDPQSRSMLLDGYGALAARGQRVRGLVAPPAADLHERRRRCVQPISEPNIFASGGLDADVVPLPRPQARLARFDDRLQRRRSSAAMTAIFCGDRLVLADRQRPTARARCAHCAARSSAPLRDARARRRAARGGRCSAWSARSSGPRPPRPIRFSFGHPHVGEPDHAVLDAAQAHERHRGAPP